MFEGWLGVFVFVGIAVYAENLAAWLFGCFYWFRDKHRADRVTFEVAARCKCHPQLEGRAQTKWQAVRKLEAAVKLGSATEKAG